MRGLNISSDAFVSGVAGIASSANASTTAGNADADALSSTITGAALEDGPIDVGGNRLIVGQANFGLSASSNNVSGTLGLGRVQHPLLAYRWPKW